MTLRGLSDLARGLILPTRPEAKEAFQSLARRLGVASHVHFLGRVETETLVALCNCCDLFIMTSRHAKDGDFEGFGIAVVEAALCGMPAVVSNSSGLTEAIKEGDTGYSVPEDDERATAKAVLDLLADERARNEMGQAARERALQTQTWAHRAREYDVLLRRICEQESTDSLKES